MYKWLIVCNLFEARTRLVHMLSHGLTDYTTPPDENTQKQWLTQVLTINLTHYCSYESIAMHCLCWTHFRGLNLHICSASLCLLSRVCPVYQRCQHDVQCTPHVKVLSLWPLDSHWSTQVTVSQLSVWGEGQCHMVRTSTLLYLVYISKLCLPRLWSRLCCDFWCI